MTRETTGIAPPDVRWRIESHVSVEGLSFRHEIKFPSGNVGHAEFSSEGRRLKTNDLRLIEHRIFENLESLLEHKTLEGEPLLGEEVSAAIKAVGAELTDILLPENVCDLFRRHARDIQSILLETDYDGLPWELARVGEPGDEEFLCLRANLGRWPTAEGIPEPVDTFSLRRVFAATAGEVGTLPSLEVSEEVEALRKGIRQNPGMTGDLLKDATAAAFLDRLGANSPDLIHFSGHGSTDSQDPQRALLIFSERSLGVHELSREALLGLRETRPLVFLNACRTSRRGQSLTGIGGWPDRWLRVGRCGALVCTQWAVRDGTASRFARNLYDPMLDDPESTLGGAFREARQRTLEDGLSDPTPLAYVLFGHPNARFLLGDPELRRAGRSAASSMAGSTGDPPREDLEGLPGEAMPSAPGVRALVERRSRSPRPRDPQKTRKPMDLEQARNWLVVTSLLVSGSLFVFLLLAPTLGYPLKFGQSIQVLQVVLPVFMGYLGSASYFVFRQGARNTKIRPGAERLLGILVKAPMILSSLAMFTVFLAFGLSNRLSAPQQGTGMELEQLTGAVSLALAFQAVTTSILASYLFSVTDDSR